MSSAPTQSGAAHRRGASVVSRAAGRASALVAVNANYSTRTTPPNSGGCCSAGPCLHFLCNRSPSAFRALRLVDATKDSAMYDYAPALVVACRARVDWRGDHAPDGSRRPVSGRLARSVDFAQSRDTRPVGGRGRPLVARLVHGRPADSVAAGLIACAISSALCVTSRNIAIAFGSPHRARSRGIARRCRRVLFPWRCRRGSHSSRLVFLSPARGRGV